ncbi:MAG: BRO family protein [Saprospiraceae bacterium]|nr:BRO family protein [Saprospiraceae bacterium]MDP5091563.1 BRO family protein [Saprospiraceae bacterium]
MMSNIKLFEEKHVRSVYNKQDEKWYFSVQDVVQILTNSNDVKQYIKKMLTRDEQLKNNWGTICTLVEMKAADGKIRKIQAAHTEHILRLLQSIPSPKAEPFKQWLAQVGAERIAEIENPELAQARIRTTYKAKGYSDAWIEKRIRGIQARDELTNEWKNRGVKEGKEYSILTAEISKATFGIIPSEYKNLKGLTKPSENLRDHMTDLELIFTMLGEASTTEIAKNKNAQGFIENQKAAKAGGNVAGNARKELEKKSGAKIVNKQNFKNLEMPKELKDNNDL